MEFYQYSAWLIAISAGPDTCRYTAFKNGELVLKMRLRSFKTSKSGLRSYGDLGVTYNGFCRRSSASITDGCAGFARTHGSSNWKRIGGESFLCAFLFCPFPKNSPAGEPAAARWATMPLPLNHKGASLRAAALSVKDWRIKSRRAHRN